MIDADRKADFFDSIGPIRISGDVCSSLAKTDMGSYEYTA
jgi:hypothetical protein